MVDPVWRRKLKFASDVRLLWNYEVARPCDWAIRVREEVAVLRFIRFVLCICILANIQNSSAKEIMHARHILTSAQNNIFNYWLKRHRNFRLATIQDCGCDEDVQMLRTGKLSGTPYPGFNPYRLVGDFNGDGKNDFAVVLVDNSKEGLEERFALLVFNGYLSRKAREPSFIQQDMKLSGYGLFFTPQQPQGPKPLGFAVALFNSDVDLYLMPDEDTYRWEAIERGE